MPIVSMIFLQWEADWSHLIIFSLLHSCRLQSRPSWPVCWKRRFYFRWDCLGTRWEHAVKFLPRLFRITWCLVRISTVSAFQATAPIWHVLYNNLSYEMNGMRCFDPTQTSHIFLPFFDMFPILFLWWVISIWSVEVLMIVNVSHR